MKYIILSLKMSSRKCETYILDQKHLLFSSILTLTLLNKGNRTLKPIVKTQLVLAEMYIWRKVIVL